MGLLCVCRLCGNTILSPNGTQLFYVLTDYTAFDGEHLGKAAVTGQASWSRALMNPFLSFRNGFQLVFSQQLCWEVPRFGTWCSAKVQPLFQLDLNELCTNIFFLGIN